MLAPGLIHVELSREAVRAANEPRRLPEAPPPDPPRWRSRTAAVLARTAVRLDGERARRALARA